jgi:hypothetical protein
MTPVDKGALEIRSPFVFSASPNRAKGNNKGVIS